MKKRMERVKDLLLQCAGSRPMKEPKNQRVKVSTGKKMMKDDGLKS